MPTFRTRSARRSSERVREASFELCDLQSTQALLVEADLGPQIFDFRQTEGFRRPRALNVQPHRAASLTRAGDRVVCDALAKLTAVNFSNARFTVLRIRLSFCQR
nr:hypothetical protein BDOA9_0200690 [Bradyrhizobium sp. DOA9]